MNLPTWEANLHILNVPCSHHDISTPAHILGGEGWRAFNCMTHDGWGHDRHYGPEVNVAVAVRVCVDCVVRKRFRYHLQAQITKCSEMAVQFIIHVPISSNKYHPEPKWPLFCMGRICLWPASDQNRLWQDRVDACIPLQSAWILAHSHPHMGRAPWPWQGEGGPVRLQNFCISYSRLSMVVDPPHLLPRRLQGGHALRRPVTIDLTTTVMKTKLLIHLDLHHIALFEIICFDSIHLDTIYSSWSNSRIGKDGPRYGEVNREMIWLICMIQTRTICFHLFPHRSSQAWRATPDRSIAPCRATCADWATDGNSATVRQRKPIEGNVGTQPIQPSFPNLFNERKRKEYCSMSIVLPKKVQWRALPF